jgi:RNA polymerase sigma-70 factor, ECF subfamily
MALPTRELKLVRPTDQELDRALIERYLRGDEGALTELVRKYQHNLLSYIYRMTGDWETAEDLVQMTFVRFHRHIRKFNLDRKFTTWIYKIASNLAKNELRDRSRKPYITLTRLSEKSERGGEADDYEFADYRMNPEVLFHKRELVRLVEETVSKLSPGRREVFVLREMEGKSYEEIAEICGMNIGTVKSRLNRARESFAAHIAPHIN